MEKVGYEGRSKRHELEGEKGKIKSKSKQTRKFIQHADKAALQYANSNGNVSY